MTEFRGIKARLKEMGVKQPPWWAFRERRRQRKATSIDLSVGITREQADALFKRIDEAMERR